MKTTLFRLKPKSSRHTLQICLRTNVQQRSSHPPIVRTTHLMKKFTNVLCPADRCIQTCLPIADALSLPLYVEFGLSEWYSPVTPGTGLHPRPAPADDLQRYFPRPVPGSSTTESKTTTTTTTTTTATTTTNMDMDRNANTNGSYIDPRWMPTYLVTRKGESVAELYARCEEFLPAFIGRVEGRRPSLSRSPSPAQSLSLSASASMSPSPAPSSPPSSSSARPGPSADAGVGVGHARVLLVSHAATVIALARALTGDAGLAGGMRVGCCTLTTLERTGVAAAGAALPPIPAAGAALFSSRDVIGRGEWTVRGVPADGAFLAGGAERCWGMADIETHVGVVVEDDGVPGSEGEEDGPNGVQIWWQTGAPRSRM